LHTRTRSGPTGRRHRNRLVGRPRPPRALARGLLPRRRHHQPRLAAGPRADNARRTRRAAVLTVWRPAYGRRRPIRPAADTRRNDTIDTLPGGGDLMTTTASKPRGREAQQGALAGIGGACRTLRLPTIRGHIDEMINAAEREQQCYTAFLADAL